MAFIQRDESMTTITHPITSKRCDIVTTMNPDQQEKAEVSKSLPPLRKLDECAVDDIAAILRLERTHYMPVFDYIRRNEAFQASPTKLVDEESRDKICQWGKLSAVVAAIKDSSFGGQMLLTFLCPFLSYCTAFDIIDYWRYDREVVSIMFFYLDRMCAMKAKQTNCPISNRYFQDFAVASLYLAIKVHGEPEYINKHQESIKPPINFFIKVTRGIYSCEDITNMERLILSTLEWHVNPPTMLCFISYLLRFLPNAWGSEPVDNRIANTIFEYAKFLTEIAVCDSSFAFQFKSSEIAYAAILCALDAKQHTIPFPYESRVAFQKKVAAATSLTPKTKAIRRARIAFKKSHLYQDAYEDLNIPVPTGGLSRRSSSAGSEGGTTSPVCVSEPLLTNAVRDQKRTRLTYE